MKRARLKPRGRLARRRQKARLAFRAQVLERSQGHCDRCGQFHGVCLHAHHYRPRSLGGSDDGRFPLDLARTTGIPTLLSSGVHKDGNSIALCGKCHEAAHARRGEAARWIDSRNKSLPDA